jgi:hypothetical protein
MKPNKTTITMRFLDYCGSKLAISAPDDPRSRKQPTRSTEKPGHNGRTGRPSRAAARMTRDHGGQRHPRTRQKDRQDAKPTARGTTTRPGLATCVKTEAYYSPPMTNDHENSPHKHDRRCFCRRRGGLFPVLMTVSWRDTRQKLPRWQGRRCSERRVRWPPRRTERLAGQSQPLTFGGVHGGTGGHPRRRANRGRIRRCRPCRGRSGGNRRSRPRCRWRPRPCRSSRCPRPGPRS